MCPNQLPVFRTYSSQPWARGHNIVTRSPTGVLGVVTYAVYFMVHVFLLSFQGCIYWLPIHAYICDKYGGVCTCDVTWVESLPIAIILIIVAGRICDSHVYLYLEYALPSAPTCVDQLFLCVCIPHTYQPIVDLLHTWVITDIEVRCKLLADSRNCKIGETNTKY